MRLAELIERYIAYRQGLGERFHTNANHLRAFGRAVGTRAAVTTVRPEQVEAFLMGAGPVTSAWHSKHNALVGFDRSALARGYVTASPLPTVLPKRPPAFIPYIYSHDEVRHLLQAAESFRSRCTRLEPATARAIILLLYGAGLRVREAITLNRADVDLADAVLTVRHTKFYKSRLVPFAGQLRDLLAQYAAGRPAAVNEPEGMAPFFCMRSGARVSQTALEHRFQRLRERANVRRSDGARYQPRLHDLRHTFAVHRLTSWYRQGADVQRLLPQLSVDLGHVYLCSTQGYLSMTPELLQEAGARFEKYAHGEGHHGREHPAGPLGPALLTGTPHRRTESGGEHAAQLPRHVLLARSLVTYLEKDEMDALLSAPDETSAQGRRDRALLLYLYNTGARADEVAQGRIADLQLGLTPGRDASLVLIRGKGNKPRRCPLWTRTVETLRAVVGNRAPTEAIFLNRRGEPLTRFGIHALVERYAAVVAEKLPSLARKQVSPHTIRHTTATHLLRAGVDINTIRAWLGHVSLQTTNVYAEVDLEMKAKALANCEIKEDKESKPWRQDPGLMEFLRTL